MPPMGRFLSPLFTFLLCSVQRDSSCLEHVLLMAGYWSRRAKADCSSTHSALVPFANILLAQ